MKKHYLKTLAIGCFSLSMLAHAADPVTLNITGNIIASPCQISSDSITKAIDLGQNIQASSLQAAGASSTWVPFTINLTSCPAGTTKAIMTMHGAADPARPADLYLSILAQQPTFQSNCKCKVGNQWVTASPIRGIFPAMHILIICRHALIP
ncbi:type 1 fimbrial protein [Klebsiella sp. T2.Ur]|nr:type 1 fimbrial protein [Klebsiella sp. T2.Ur]